MKKKEIFKPVWAKLPVDLLTYDQVAELYAREGAKGLGAYLVIMLQICSRKSESITRQQLRSIVPVGCSKAFMRRITTSYGLFDFDEKGCVRSTVDFMRMASAKPQGDIPTRPRTFKEREREGEDDYHHHKGEGGENPDAIKSAEECIRSLRPDTEATEAAVMRCGFSRLLMAHWMEALEEFRRHALANDTLRTILSPGQAQRYFTHYITNPTSGAILQKHLQSIDARQRTEATAAGTFAELPTVPSRRTANGWEPI